MRDRMWMAAKAAMAAALGTAMPAHAQLTDELGRCAAIAVNADRLACYDGAVATISPETQAISKRRAAETARLEREAAAAAAVAANEAARAEAEARKQAFGTRQAYAKEAEARVQKVEGTVKTTILAPTGATIVILDNGQVWAQLESRGLPSIRTGDAVEVNRNAFGGFEMTLMRSKRAFQVKRIN